MAFRPEAWGNAIRYGSSFERPSIDMNLPPTWVGFLKAVHDLMLAS